MDWVNEAWDKSIDKLSKTADRLEAVIPYTTKDGLYQETSRINWWTNGFWPGILWYMYKETSDKKYAEYAEACEVQLDEVLKGFDRVSHDAGFMWMHSAVADYEITGNETSRKRALTAASILAARFNVKGNFIRAWDHDDTDGQGPRTGWAIIDCLMNLPLLYWASLDKKDPRFKHIAMEHADTVLKYFVRDDGSMKHIVRFDPDSGEYIDNLGGQGYDANSSWTRGTAWAIHGFAMSYHYTGEVRYLDAAKRIAHFFLAALPEDNVPFADFKAPDETNTNKDTSAGAIAASGMLLISKIAADYEKHIYFRGAIKILKALYEDHTSWDGSDEALLKNGCEAYHSKTGANMPLIYGDYFFLEALAQLRGMESLFIY